MNRLQWLQVWGFSARPIRERRRRSPLLPSKGQDAFGVFMRRMTDRSDVQTSVNETVAV